MKPSELKLFEKKWPVTNPNTGETVIWPSRGAYEQHKKNADKQVSKNDLASFKDPKIAGMNASTNPPTIHLYNNPETFKNRMRTFGVPDEVLDNVKFHMDPSGEFATAIFPNGKKIKVDSTGKSVDDAVKSGILRGISKVEPVDTELSNDDENADEYYKKVKKDQIKKTDYGTKLPQSRVDANQTEEQEEEEEEEESEENSGSKSSVIQKLWTSVNRGKIEDGGFLIDPGSGEMLLIESVISLPLISGSDFHNVMTNSKFSNKQYDARLLAELYTLTGIDPKNITAKQYIKSSGQMQQHEQRNDNKNFRNQKLPRQGKEGLVRLPNSISGKLDVNAYFYKNDDVVRVSLDANAENFERAMSYCEKAVQKVFGKLDNVHHYSDDSIIIWNNVNKAPIGDSINLVHLIKIPTTEYALPNNSKKQTFYDMKEKFYSNNAVEHVFVGIITTNTKQPGIQTNIIGNVDRNTIKSTFGSFQINQLETVLPGWYAWGKMPAKRMSKVDPVNVTGMDKRASDSDLEQATPLGVEVLGKRWNDPFTDLDSSITQQFGNSAKTAKLLEINKAFVGDSPAASVSLPKTVDQITIDKCDMSTNAIAVNYMEVLHPLMLMKPNLVRDNGVGEALEKYARGGDLASARVLFPYKRNFPVIDSVLEIPVTVRGKTEIKTIMISSKEKVGCKASVGGLANVGNFYINFEYGNNITDSTVLAFSKVINFLQHMSAGPVAFSEEVYDQKTKAIKSDYTVKGGSSVSNWANTVIADAASLKLKSDRAAAKRLDENLNQSKIGLEFSEFMLACYRNSAIVQMNTFTKQDFDKGDLTLSHVVATWPDKTYDSLSFIIGSGKIQVSLDIGQKSHAAKGSIGFGSIETPAAEPTRVRLVAKTDYPEYTKKLPGLKADERRQGIKWNTLVKELIRQFNDIKKQESAEDLAPTLEDDEEFQAYWKAVSRYVSEEGMDPDFEREINQIRKILYEE